MGYIHGVYSEIAEQYGKTAGQSQSMPVYVGTAPVHTTVGFTERVNKPVVVKSFAEAVRLMGYSDDWVKYTLCEAVYAHFVAALRPVGPICLINVLDPAKDKGTAGTQSAAVTARRAVLTGMGEAVFESLTITGKTLGQDYTAEYSHTKATVTLTELVAGALGATAAVKYDTVDPDGVTKTQIIGAVDANGRKSGLAAVADVYEVTGRVHSLLCVPGYSHIPEVHAAMGAVCYKLNGHHFIPMFTDLPTMTGTAVTVLDAVAGWKKTNGYDLPYETPHYPLAKGTDGRVYHLSVLASVAKQGLELEGGVPYRSPSNQAVPIVGIYFGGDIGVVSINQETVNQCLNQHGIRSACRVGGQWVLWGAHTGAYAYEDRGEKGSQFETEIFMRYYLANWFQETFGPAVDHIMSKNRAQSIVTQVQQYLDALVAAGALVQGKAAFLMENNPESDLLEGDLRVDIDISTAPLIKGITGHISWSKAGIDVIFKEG